MPPLYQFARPLALCPTFGPTAAVRAGLLVLMMGCGGGRTVICGVVTLDGKPVVENAYVSFIPDQGNGRTVTVRCDGGGRYYTAAVSGIPYRVEICASKFLGIAQDGTFLNENIVPYRYGDRAKTPLKVTPVEGQRTVADFSLTSQP